MKIRLFFGLLVSPVVLLIGMGLLFSWIGWKSIIAIIMALLIIPLQMYFGKLMGSALEQVNERKDERLNIITDFLTSIKYIKTYVWEKVFV